MSKNNLVVDRAGLAYTMSRVFDAPRELVWKACTDPELLPKWWGPRYLTTVVDKMDLKVGGVWRYIQKDAEGNEYAFNGVFKEVAAPERLTYTFEFEPMAGHISTETITFEELPDGKTRITARTTFDTLEDLEGMLQSGMEGGAVETWDRLEELLAVVRKEKR
ncbi:MAG TPA: SRPBCC family protein [Anaerolineales bacterium]|nr:SRPBCC family protein [Anaerolineales bacterium]